LQERNTAKSQPEYFRNFGKWLNVPNISGENEQRKFPRADSLKSYSCLVVGTAEGGKHTNRGSWKDRTTDDCFRSSERLHSARFTGFENSTFIILVNIYMVRQKEVRQNKVTGREE
jgi:hypothetical protein